MLGTAGAKRCPELDVKPRRRRANYSAGMTRLGRALRFRCGGGKVWNRRVGWVQTFRPHRASNRLDGSRSESGKPARHIGAIAFILGSVALAERRLLIGNYDNVKKEPDQRAVAEEMPVSE